jgi:predicted dehydrogenase
MDKLPLCLVGCGGMGHRHIFGFAELMRSGMGNIDLIAVCDLNEENARLCALEAERQLGKKPVVYTDFEQVLASSEVAAVDVVTEPAVHHTLAVPALRAGKHVLVEKPLGITVKACKAMIDVAQEGDTVLATAENYRRDPVNRFAKAVIDSRLLGAPYLMISKSLGGDSRFSITPWRHLKERGTIALDYGVHIADIMQYLLGDIVQIFGTGMIVEPVRYRPERIDHPLESYRRRFESFPESIEATGEDSVIALFQTRSGAMIEFVYVSGGSGVHTSERTVHGPLGSLHLPGDRNGGVVTLSRDGHELSTDDLLPEVPEFRLNPITERLFGERTARYNIPFAETDAKTLAIEFHDFADAALHGHEPEVDGIGGLTAVATILGAFESGMEGRSVSMDEMLSGQVNAYQKEIDVALCL